MNIYGKCSLQKVYRFVSGTVRLLETSPVFSLLDDYDIKMYYDELESLYFNTPRRNRNPWLGLTINYQNCITVWAVHNYIWEVLLIRFIITCMQILQIKLNNIYCVEHVDLQMIVYIMSQKNRPWNDLDAHLDNIFIVFLMHLFSLFIYTSAIKHFENSNPFLNLFPEDSVKLKRYLCL